MGFRHFLPTTQEPQKLWFMAIITRETDGIGKAFAFQLAQKGLHLILVSRNLSKLKEVSNEIISVYPTTKIKIFIVDFSNENMVAGVRVMQKVIYGEQRDMRILVNNIGVTYPAAQFFHEVEEEVWMNVMKVNVIGTSLVIGVVIKGMVERKRGVIVNIGSCAAIIVPSHPLCAIYAINKV